MYTYMYVCIYIHILIYTHVYIYIYIYTYIYIYIHTCIHIYVYIYVCMCIRTGTYMYICTHVYIYIHTYVHTDTHTHIYIYIYTCIIYIYDHVCICMYPVWIPKMVLDLVCSSFVVCAVEQNQMISMFWCSNLYCNDQESRFGWCFLACDFQSRKVQSAIFDCSISSFWLPDHQFLILESKIIMDIL